MSRSSSHHSQDEQYGHLRHPNPDLQAEQGAYIANVERLEEEAERISHPASDIAEEIRKMREEQKARESRTSTMYSRRAASGADPQSPLGRQLSHEYGSYGPNSVIGTSNVARSAGYSPAAYVGSPRGSIRSGSWEQVSSPRSRHDSQPQTVRLAQLVNEQLTGGESFTKGDFVSSPTEYYPAHVSQRLPIPRSSGSDVAVASVGATDVYTSHDHKSGNEANYTAATHPTEAERPSTHASTDTFERSRSLFENFDGVHVQDQAPEQAPDELPEVQDDPEILPEFMDKRVSSMIEPLTEEMVYYPAPVPAMINLPKRLSKLPSAPHRDKRRTQFLSTLEEDTPRSALWPQNPLSPVLGHETQNEFQDTSINDRRPDLHELPPQLRASMYFDYPAAQQEVRLKDGSAVKTLDSILDASADLPVTAFTDHPFVGRAGAHIYDRAAGQISDFGAKENRRRSSSLNLLKRNSRSDVLEGAEPRKSSLLSFARIGRQSRQDLAFVAPESHMETEAASLHDEGAPLQSDDKSDQSGGSERHDADGQSRLEPDEEAEFDEATQPATLLGELELRKRQQKQRNRTAGGAPNGMHATLLQQDAVAQLQQASRGKQKVTLAWEDAHAHDKENEDNEDIPLAMLNIKRKVERHQPIGLIARKDLEDNEPLSHRRARLRGEDPLAAQRQRDFKVQMAREVDATGEEETLGQRRERLKRDKEAAFRPVGGDFASEVLSQFGGLEPKENVPAPSKTPEGLEEETLGQRRQRLQAEKDSRQVSQTSSNAVPTEGAQTSLPAKRRSMADILHAHPTLTQDPGRRIISNGSGQGHVFAPAAPTQRQTSWSQQVNQSSLTMTTGLGAMAKGNSRQHDMVDRWRQSIQG